MQNDRSRRHGDDRCEPYSRKEVIIDVQDAYFPTTGLDQFAYTETDRERKNRAREHCMNKPFKATGLLSPPERY